MFEELKVFLTVAETKNFTKAAKKLNFSQPAISQQIKKLEIFFQNTPLLIRSANSKQIELTEGGKLVCRYGREILSLLDTVQGELARTREDVTRPLLIGASMTIGTHLLPRLLRELHRCHPEVTPKLFIGNTRQICEKLDRGEIDLGLIEGKTMYYNFKREDFFSDPLVLVASPELAGSCPEFSPSGLGKVPWIIRENGSGTEQYLQAFLESNHILIGQKIECNSNEANCELVKEGLGVTFISRLVVNRELRSGELVQLPMNRSYSRKFSYIIREEQQYDPTVNLFVEVLQRAAKAWQE